MRQGWLLEMLFWSCRCKSQLAPTWSTRNQHFPIFIRR